MRIDPERFSEGLGLPFGLMGGALWPCHPHESLETRLVTIPIEDDTESG